MILHKLVTKMGYQTSPV